MLTDVIEVLKNKVLTGSVSTFMVVSGEAEKRGLIDITQQGWIFPWASWMQIIGCVWISLLILEKIGVFKLIKYLFEKFRK